MAVSVASNAASTAGSTSARNVRHATTRRGQRRFERDGTRRKFVDVGAGRAREHRHLEHGIGDRGVRRAGRGEAHPARRAVAPDDADRGLVADQAAHRRRDADRTAAVGGRREWCETGRERGRRTSTRSTRRAVVVPRVARRAVNQVVGERGPSERRRVRLARRRSRRRRVVGRRSRRRPSPESRRRTAVSRTSSAARRRR